MSRAKHNPKAAACIEEVLEVLKKHDFMLAHEDTGGAFILRPRTEDDVKDCEEWLREAFLDPE